MRGARVRHQFDPKSYGQLDSRNVPLVNVRIHNDFVRFLTSRGQVETGYLLHIKLPMDALRNHTFILFLQSTVMRLPSSSSILLSLAVSSSSSSLSALAAPTGDCPDSSSAAVKRDDMTGQSDSACYQSFHHLLL